MKKVVIAGSVSLKNKSQNWKKIWGEKGFQVTNYPQPIPKANFLAEYPNVHKKFFQDIVESDVLFIMNEDKNGVVGYIGAETFAELCFGVSQNLINNKNIEIILCKMPETRVQSYDEIAL